jgi:hypothetical protein
MLLDPQEPQSCIALSPMVLDELKSMSAGPLKVYIYLCACYKSQPISAPIHQLKAATGLKQRAVIDALKALLEKDLITRNPGSGNKPNQYGIPLPKRHEDTVLTTDDTTPSSPELGQTTSSVASPTRATTLEQVTAPPSATSSRATAPSATPTRAIIQELVASCYRPITEQEFLWIKEAYPDEVVLCEMLARFKRNGHGVDADRTPGRFLQVLKHFT